MSRLHSTFVALVLAAATSVGLFAAVHTVQLGQKVAAPRSAPVAARDLASRQARLDRWSKSLQRERVKHPPALPKLPKFAPVQAPQAGPASPAATAAATASAPQVRYVRPRPVVRYRHASPSAKTSASSQSSSSDDGGSDDGATGGAGDDGPTGGGD
jgi:hypothetical protein